MTALVDIVNLALQDLGTRTTVTTAQLNANSSNEAIQANIAYPNVRPELLRMAPWNCAFNTANLTLITAVPGTPENQSPAPQLWGKGQPAPPWSYEYQLPVDSLRFCWITPQIATGFAGGIPITTAVTGGAPSYWQGPPVKFITSVDQFLPVTAAAVASGGANYLVGDIITLASGLTTNPPIGAPAQLLVTGVGGGGAVTSVSVVNQIRGEAVAQGGSYFLAQANPVAQGTTTGVGSGATFTLTQGPSSDQRVILTNQEFAIGNYVRDVTDINVFDDQFITALHFALATRLALPLKGDKDAAKLALLNANNKIAEARKTDGNEGLTINDVTPDWIRTRGIWSTEGYSGPYNNGFDWGGWWTGYYG